MIQQIRLGNEPPSNDFVIYNVEMGDDGNPRYYFRVQGVNYSAQYHYEDGLKNLRYLNPDKTESKIIKRTKNSIQKYFNARVFYKGINMPCTEMLSIQCKQQLASLA